MNRSLFIILIPALLVAAGYIFVFRLMGIAPGYPRLIVVMVLFFAAWGLAGLVGRDGRLCRSASEFASALVERPAVVVVCEVMLAAWSAGIYRSSSRPWRAGRPTARRSPWRSMA